jgi:hypothetical protein
MSGRRADISGFPVSGPARPVRIDGQVSGRPGRPTLAENATFCRAAALDKLLVGKKPVGTGDGVRLLAFTVLGFVTALTGCVSDQERTAQFDAADRDKCISYGANPGTPAYTDCRLKMACAHGPPRPRHLGPFRLPPRKRIVQLQPVARVALVFEQGSAMILNASPCPA